MRPYVKWVKEVIVLQLSGQEAPAAPRRHFLRGQ